MSAILRLPEVLTGMEEATLTAWHVQVGDEVAVGQPLADVETEKATVEYVADVAGMLAELLVGVEEPIRVGTPLVLLATEGESIDEARAGVRGVGGEAEVGADRSEVDGSHEVEPVAPLGATPGDDRPQSVAERLRATPLVRRLAKLHDIDLGEIVGTGPSGRIVRRDVERMLTTSSASPAWGESTATSQADEPASDPGEVSPQPVGAQDSASWIGHELEYAPNVVPHSRMRRAIARRLTESKATVPHFYLTADCRVDALLALRAQLNDGLDDKLSVNDFVVKAVAGALADVPQMNATWTDDATLLHHQSDVAIAVALEDGLVTPVVRDAGRRSVGDISRTVRDLVDRARSGSLRQAELEGGAFTVSNLGMYGTEQFAAIINPPHAVGAATQRPVAVNGQLEVGTVMTVTLSGDHRVADGATGARWLAAFVRRVEHPMLALV